MGFLGIDWVVYIIVMVGICSICFLAFIEITKNVVFGKLNISLLPKNTKVSAFVKPIFKGSIIVVILITGILTFFSYREISLMIKNTKNCTSLKVAYFPGFFRAVKYSHECLKEGKFGSESEFRERYGDVDSNTVREVTISDQDVINKITAVVSKGCYLRIPPEGAYATKIVAIIEVYKNEKQIDEYTLIGVRRLVLGNSHFYYSSNNRAYRINEILEEINDKKY